MLQLFAINYIFKDPSRPTQFSGNEQNTLCSTKENQAGMVMASSHPSFTNCPVKERYDTRCYFNVRSKADISQLNLPHGTDN